MENRINKDALEDAARCHDYWAGEGTIGAANALRNTREIIRAEVVKLACKVYDDFFENFDSHETAMEAALTAAIGADRSPAPEAGAVERAPTAIEVGLMQAAYSDAARRADTVQVAAWRSMDSAPKEPGARIRVLMEADFELEEHSPALLMGGWRQVDHHNDKRLGWLPSAPLPEGRG